MAGSQSSSWWRGAGMLAVAALWGMAHYAGWLMPLEQWALGVRFRLRGPLESSARVVYVNRDVAASQEFGRAWFPREYYAMAGEALLDLGEARILFFDFVLTSNHLPKKDARAMTYAGNLAMQRFLLTHPGQVVLGAAYDGKRYPFAEYASALPDRRDGAWRVEDGIPRGYDPARNSLPELPEFPLWCPPIDHPTFPFPGIGEVGLINTSTELNIGEQVHWVPAIVGVENDFPAIFVANGMRRWQETVAWQAGRATRFKAAAGPGDVYLVCDENGAVLNGVPTHLPQRFLSASLVMFALGHPGTTWTEEGGSLVLRDSQGTLVREVPLRFGQHLAVNWYSPWHVGDAALRAEVEQFAQNEKEEGFGWSVPQIGKNPDDWIAEVEAGNPAAIDPVRLWKRDNDPYNPKVSIGDVLMLYEAYQIALEKGATRTPELIKDVFGQFKDAYILVGPTDPMLQDLAPTPFDEDPVPKVSVHGNLLKSLEDGRFLLQSAPWELPLYIVVLTALVGGLASAGGERSWLWKWIAGGLLFSFLVLAQLTFNQWNWVVPMVAPAGAAVSAGAVGIGWRLWDEERQKARIRNLFGTYVSPDVVDLMVDSAEEPQLGGHQCDVTAFFSDIEGFSSIGELLPADELVELMNEYLDAMTAVLNGERGTLDKYIGDAIVGIFGAPYALADHASRSCEAALRIQSEQVRLCARWRSAGDLWPERVKSMRTRIGLHSGEAVVGNMGSRQRFTYTMMGDSVNLASRLEQLGKTYGVAIIVSEATRAAALRERPCFVYRFLDRVAVKGREQPVAIYELIGRTASVDGGTLECITLYEAGLEAYFDRNLQDAIKFFERSASLEARAREPLNPSAMMIRRCWSFIETPPDGDWDGVFVMSEK